MSAMLEAHGVSKRFGAVIARGVSSAMMRPL